MFNTNDVYEYQISKCCKAMKKYIPLVGTLKSDGCALNKKKREAYNLIVPDNCSFLFFKKVNKIALTCSFLMRLICGGQ